MLSKEDVLNRLKGVIYPGFEKDIVSFGFVKNVEIGDKILIEVEIVSSNPDVANELRTDIKRVMGSNECVINIIQPKIPEEKSNTQSGKVGTQPQVVGNKLKPILTHGVEMMSMGVLMEEGMSLIWRGSMIMKAIEQLLKDVFWSELDVLFLDMPPGTGDAQLTLAQSVPVTAGVCVTTPQVVALDDSKRALDMFEKLHIPIAGVIENMSGFICPESGKEYDIFGKGTTEEVAKAYGTEVLAEIPIEPAVRVGGDSGKPVSFYEPNSVTAKRYEKAAARLWEIIEGINNEGGADNSSIQPVMDGKSACSK